LFSSSLFPSYTFLHDTAPTQLYTLSLHDALPISRTRTDFAAFVKSLVDGRYKDAEKVVLVVDNLNTHTLGSLYEAFAPEEARRIDRKSTRLNSSHVKISYAVFCLKKKKKKNNRER